MNLFPYVLGQKSSPEIKALQNFAEKAPRV